MKDAIIQLIDRDLDEAEDQYQTELRSHIHNVDKLIQVFNSNMNQLGDEFHAEQQQIMDDFSLE